MTISGVIPVNYNYEYQCTFYNRLAGSNRVNSLRVPAIHGLVEREES